MTAQLAPEVTHPTDHAVLGDLLGRAAGGDRAAFMRFYDATCDVAHRLDVCRLRDRAAAQEATCARYVSAWIRAHEHAGSGRSPLAWLLTLPIDADEHARGGPHG